MKKEIITDGALVSHIADLAKLSVNDTDFEDMIKDMNDMICFATKLSEVDCKELIAVASHMRESIFREDKAGTCLERKTVLAMAKTKNEKYITVPRVIEA